MGRSLAWSALDPGAALSGVSGPLLIPNDTVHFNANWSEGQHGLSALYNRSSLLRARQTLVNVMAAFAPATSVAQSHYQ